METRKITQDDINRTVWKACDTFRGVIDPSQYKDYILTMLFLKYVYLGIVALLLVLIVANMFKKDKFLYQLDAALVIIPLILRLLLIK